MAKRQLLDIDAASGIVLSGVGALEPGMTVSVEVEGVGTLVNPVVAR